VEPPALTLCSQGLLSKWGFNDGDMPEELMDYWDTLGVDYSDIDWRDALRKLVRTYLLPQLEANHHITIYDIETIHNPIRAATVDGLEIDDTEDTDIRLVPEHITIQYNAVATACELTTGRPTPNPRLLNASQHGQRQARQQHLPSHPTNQP